MGLYPTHLRVDNITADTVQLHSSHNLKLIRSQFLNGMSSAGSASQGLEDERERGMSPSTSQQWDFETLSVLSQPATIEEILEEPEKRSCWLATKERLARLGVLAAPLLFARAKEPFTVDPKPAVHVTSGLFSHG